MLLGRWGPVGCARGAGWAGGAGESGGSADGQGPIGPEVAGPAGCLVFEPVMGPAVGTQVADAGGAFGPGMVVVEVGVGGFAGAAEVPAGPVPGPGLPVLCSGRASSGPVTAGARSPVPRAARVSWPVLATARRSPAGSWRAQNSREAWSWVRSSRHRAALMVCPSTPASTSASLLDSVGRVRWMVTSPVTGGRLVSRVAG